MERLTEYRCGVAVIRNKNLINKAMYDLARYEDTGLTPEEVKALKQESKNVQVDYSLLEYYKTRRLYYEDVYKKEFTATVVECREAREKQKVLKMIVRHDTDTKCKCGYLFSFSADVGTGERYYDVRNESKSNYCPECGQKLQWNDKE